MIDLGSAAAYASLFLTSFLAATILPLGSEAMVVAMATMGFPPMGLFAVATVGNTLGAVVNFGAGRLGERALSRRFKPSDLPALNNARKIIHRWGAPAMILAWAPIIGDPLTVLAGIAGMPFWRFFFWMGLGKALRYAILLAATDQARLLLG